MVLLTHKATPNRVRVGHRPTLLENEGFSDVPKITDTQTTLLDRPTDDLPTTLVTSLAELRATPKKFSHDHFNLVYTLFRNRHGRKHMNWNRG